MKKIINLSFIVVHIFMAISCSKENSSTKNEEIYSKVINLKINAELISGTTNQYRGFGYIPIETGEDYKVELSTNVYNFYRNSYDTSLLLKDGPGGNSKYFLTESNTTEYALTFELGTTINSSSKVWDYSVYGFHSDSDFSFTPRNDFKIYPGSGDKYVAIKMTLLDNTVHYGWILLNYASDALSVTVKEFAYHKIPGNPIKIGEK